MRYREWLRIKKIYEKFNTTVSDFIKSQFQSIFENSKYKYKFVYLYLVADVYKETTKAGKHIPKDSLKVDSELTKKIYKIHGKICRIEYILPTNLIIKKEDVNACDTNTFSMAAVQTKMKFDKISIL
ncbi:MAG: hypothetical protein PUH90_02425 [Clostridia bacterium]|nr:hypothetical protein [Clostridia bacterium]